jgi:hypothetical protein
MRRIWKYELDTTDEQYIIVPTLVNGSCQVRFLDQILKTDIQHDQLCLWCLVDVTSNGDGSYDAQYEKRKIIIVGTGNPMPDYLSKDHYVGTCQLYGGS